VSITAEMDLTGVRQLISFTVGAEEYGLELRQVKEIIRMGQITRLPRAPEFVKGIINLRGQVIPIVDLRQRFGLPRAEDTVMTRVIVVEAGGVPVGLVVDSASQVVRVPMDQIEPPPPFLGTHAGDFIDGVGKLDDRIIITVDAARILSLDELSEISGSLKAAV